MIIAENTKDDSDMSIATRSLIISAVIVTEEDECISSQARESRRYVENAGFAILISVEWGHSAI